MLRSTCYAEHECAEHSPSLLLQEYDMHLYHDYNHSTFKGTHSWIRVSTANRLCPLYKVR